MKKPTSLSLSKKATDFLNTQDNKSVIPNELVEALANNKANLAFIQSRLMKVDYARVVEIGLEALTVEASRVKPLSIGDLGGEPGEPEEVVPSRVPEVESYIKANRPTNWSQIEEAFPGMSLDEDFFRGSRIPLQNNYYKKEFLAGIGAISLPGGGLSYHG